MTARSDPGRSRQRPAREIGTRRLTLRPLRPEDAHQVQRLAGERAIAASTLRIPHPYEDGMAEAWIRLAADRWDAGKEVVFAIVRRAGVEPGEEAKPGKGSPGEDPVGELIGAVGLQLDPENRQAELGYWIGRPYWGRGFATEAAGAALRYGFEDLGLNRIHAHHFAHNEASGRVLGKIGMQREGRRRQHAVKWGRAADVLLYGILRCDWEGE